MVLTTCLRSNFIFSKDSVVNNKADIPEFDPLEHNNGQNDTIA